MHPYFSHISCLYLHAQLSIFPSFPCWLTISNYQQIWTVLGSRLIIPTITYFKFFDAILVNVYRKNAYQTSHTRKWNVRKPAYISMARYPIKALFKLNPWLLRIIIAYMLCELKITLLIISNFDSTDPNYLIHFFFLHFKII